MFIVAAEKAQKPAKGVRSGAPSLFNSLRSAVILEDAENNSSARSSHHPEGAGTSRRGGSIGPDGRELEFGKNGTYSRHKNSTLSRRH